MTDTRFYVASLSDYNNGHMHGIWIAIDGDTERSEVDAKIARLLRNSKHPNVTVQVRECVRCLHTDAEDGSTDWECPECGGSEFATDDNPSAEEWAVHDYDGIPASFGEHPDLDDLLEFAKGVEEHGDAFRAWVEDRGVTNFIHEDYEDKYAGEADSELDWIEQHLDDAGVLNDMPENLRSYFDSEAYLRDMKLGGDVSLVEFDGTVYAFWS